MRNFLKFAIAAGAALAFSSTAAVAQVTDDGDATIEVRVPLTIAADQTMDFGAVLAPAAGTETFQPETPGTFDVTGEEGAGVDIILPTDPVNLTRVDGAETIAISNFTSDQADDAFTLGAGVFTFEVEADAEVAAGQEPGVYNGTYTVEVAYN